MQQLAADGGGDKKGDEDDQAGDDVGQRAVKRFDERGEDLAGLIYLLVHGLKQEYGRQNALRPRFPI